MSLTCVVPARNEQGHLNKLIGDILSVNHINEVIIVEGGSRDDTFNEATLLSAKYPSKVKVLKQIGKGKFNAVLLGASFAKNEDIVIWDADGTVPLESSKKLIEIHFSNNNFTMGNRLLGKIEKGAMPRLNYLGNWFFALLWVPIIGHKPADMLCGTKIFKKTTISKIPKWLLKYDPYGDFALVATALANGDKIASVPVNYNKRSYGESNINRWFGGIQLIFVTLIVYAWLFKIKLSAKLVKNSE